MLSAFHYQRVKCTILSGSAMHCTLHTALHTRPPMHCDRNKRVHQNFILLLLLMFFFASISNKVSSRLELTGLSKREYPIGSFQSFVCKSPTERNNTIIFAKILSLENEFITLAHCSHLMNIFGFQ